MVSISQNITDFLDYLKSPRNDIEKLGFNLGNVVAITALHILVLTTTILVFALLMTAIGMDESSHKLEDMFEQYKPWQIFLLAVIVAPILEELVFRLPLILGFKKEGNRKYFKYFFYTIAALFALIHIFNFNDEIPFYLVPLMVLPQFTLALLLGFVRMRFGMWANIYVHMFNNFLPMSFMLLFGLQ